jgi:elongation factor 1 alpha-like protein
MASNNSAKPFNATDFFAQDLTSTSTMSPTAPHLPFSVKDFFASCPWFRIPPERKAEIIIEQRYPHLGTGLLGGTSNAPAGKVSKLAALAAARRKKENENRAGDGAATGLSALQKLRSGRSGLPAASKTQETTPMSESKPHIQEDISKIQPTQLPIREKPKPEELDPVEVDKKLETSEDNATATTPHRDAQRKKARYHPPDLRAAPSAFASVMFGGHDSQATEGPGLQVQHNVFSMLFGGMNNTKSFDFAVPSPDAVALSARNSKGSNDTARDRDQQTNILQSQKVLSNSQKHLFPPKQKTT